MARLSVLALIQVGDRHENESELADMAVEAQVAGLFGAEPQIQRHVAVAGVDWVLVHDGVHPVLGAHDLYVCICVCIYVHLYLSIYLSIGLSVCLSVCLSVSLSLSLSFDRSIYMSRGPCGSWCARIDVGVLADEREATNICISMYV